MPFSLMPRVQTPKLTDITAEQLRRWGVRLLMLDFDNTIVPYTCLSTIHNLVNLSNTINDYIFQHFLYRDTISIMF